MKLYPWDEAIAKADEYCRKGADVFQQFNCEHCGTKQTMSEPNSFHATGICEECGKITDIKKNGTNYMLQFGVRSPND